MIRFRTLFISFILIFTLSTLVNAQKSNCLVLLPKISGEYTGDCKKGKAQGVGESVGEDSYKGEFKKGFPHGTGMYVWNNGNSYTGNWKEGLKEGEGELTIVRDNLPDSIIVGFWKEDKYIGKYENPYTIESKSSNINKLRVVKKSLAPNQFELIVMRKNTPVGISNLRINSNSGTFYKKKNIVNTFPLELEIEFDSNSASGFGATKEKFNCKVKIMEEGNWQITIDLTNV